MVEAMRGATVNGLLEIMDCVLVPLRLPLRRRRGRGSGAGALSCY